MGDESSLPALAIELSQQEGSVVACNAFGKTATRSFPSGRRDRDLLLPAIDEVVAEIEVTPRDLKLIAVDIGPGGFTGLRISIATAQAIAEVTGAALVGVDGSAVAAASTAETRDFPGEVLVFLASKKDTAWCSHLVCAEGRWQEIVPSGIVSCVPESEAGYAIADEHLPSSIREDLVASGIQIVSPVHDAMGVLQQAQSLLKLGGTTTPEELLPRYPREPEAVRIWRNLR